MGEGTATPPQLGRRRIIERPRLIRMLDESPERIKLLVAPAGYGKTTLARQWLSPRSSLWLNLTDASRDVGALATQLCMICRATSETAGESLVQRLRVTPDAAAEAETLAGMLAQDLLAWPSQTWLVIDDYESIAISPPAERFVGAFVSETSARVLVLARRRPLWASSRRIVYGDVFEIGRERLAMTAEEAAYLLRSHTHAAGLVAASGGWPAMIGLAATSGITPPDLESEPRLLEFFADEIFNRLDVDTQEFVASLAVYETEARRLAIRRLPELERQALIARAMNAGLLSQTGPETVEIHPLIRTFLEHRVLVNRWNEVRDVASSIAEELLTSRAWDEAYGLIERFGLNELLPELIRLSVDELLASGRTQTIEHWTAAALTDDSAIQLARSEVALRSGRYYEAEALARLAASERVGDPAATALLVAGRAAHVAAREQEAATYYQEALNLATGDACRLRAELGLIQAGLELEDLAVLERLAELDKAPILDPEVEVMLADRRLGVETRFCLPVDVARGRAAQQLLPLVDDPMVRTSFRNVSGYALAAMYELEEADKLTQEQLEDAERCRLDFVLPYAQAVIGLIRIGQRDYDAAAAALSEVRDRASASGDHAVRNVALPIEARMWIAQGAFEVVLALPPALTPPATRSLSAEYAACRALALVAIGKYADAARLARDALDASIAVEVQVCSNAALALCAMRDGSHELAEAHTAAAIDQALKSRMTECLVTAVRAFPELALPALREAANRPELERVLRIAGVAPQQFGQQIQGSAFSLSPREREVLSLVAKGMSNAAIGEALFISTVTVKVHVRNIFSKLGVHSRAEAALRAGQLPL